MTKLLITSLAFLMVSLAVAETASAQILDRVIQRVEREAERRIEDRLVRAAIRAMDATEDAIVCVATDPECIQEARDDDAELIIVDEDGEPISYENDPREQQAEPAAPPAAATTVAPGEGAWANYDFVPGDRVLFVDDFSNDMIGRFPQRLEFVNGMMEVVEWEGMNLLRSTDTRSTFRVSLPETLPDRFTIEFDAFFQSRRLSDVIGVSTAEMARRIQNPDHSLFYLSPRTAGVRGPNESTTDVNLPDDDFVTVRISVDGSYAAMYVDERRVANIPNAEIPRSDFVEIRLGQHSEPSYLGNLRIAAGGREMMYDRLVSDGRWATHGVLFATASADIRPESTPTLKDIARMMQQHGDLRVRIEGHTDSVGNADANQRLSEQRAQAVVDHLVQREGISADRLEAVGMGETQPVADNSTAEGRQTNRRVELVVLD